MENSSNKAKPFFFLVLLCVLVLMTLQYTLDINVTTIKTSLKLIHSDLSVRLSASLATLLNSTLPKRHKATCPPVPKYTLKGHVHIDVGKLKSTEYNGKNVIPGGLYTPVDCEARHRVAVVVPYRDRQVHLKIFLRYMHPFLQRQNLTYGIYVIESIPRVKFNRALMFNIGFVEANKLHNYDCFIFHDVDLVPENIGIPYTCEDSPLHLSSAIDNMNYTMPYKEYFGGACAISTKHFKAINGFSNIYFGWGAEDDDIYMRINYNNITVNRLSTDLGQYKMLQHRKAKPNPGRYELLKGVKDRQMRDGLNSLKYRVLKQELKRLFTWMYISVNETDIVQSEPSNKNSSLLKSL